MDIGTRIRNNRLRLKLTQEDLSLMLGVTQKNISFYENNARVPPADILINLTKIFNVTSDYLLGLSDEDNLKNNTKKMMLTASEQQLLMEFRNLEKEYKDIVWGELMKCRKMQEQEHLSKKKDHLKKQA